jgi:hypothetical protein
MKILLSLFLTASCGKQIIGNPQMQISRLESRLKIIKDKCRETKEPVVVYESQEYSCEEGAVVEEPAQ